MKTLIVIFAIAICFISQSYCQDGKSSQAGSGFNFSKFTEDRVNITHELDSLTSQEYKSHPEYGILPYNAPCKDCIELLQKRDETHRYFIKEGTKGKEFYAQTSYSHLNYKDGNGIFHTIDSRIKPSATPGVLKATQQLAPITVNIAEKYTSILNAGKELQFNRDVNIFIIHQDGSVMSLGEANWTDYSAGDDGIVVHNLYTGIDLELHVGNGHIESFYRLNKPLQQLGDGWLVVRDNMNIPQDLVYDFTHSEKSENDSYTGTLFLNSKEGGHYFYIGTPSAYDINNEHGNAINLSYHIADNGVYDLYVPIAWMNDANRSYPLIIDPFITATSTLPLASITGSGYNGTCFKGGCTYNLNVAVPPACTVTQMTYSFNYRALGTCTLDSAAWDLTWTGNSCRSPSVGGTYHTCTIGIPGLCILQDLFCISDFQSCIPPPQCAGYNIPLVLTFYRCTEPGAGCGFSCCIADSPWVMTVTGRTLEVTTQDASVCQGSSVTLTAHPSWGVPLNSTYVYTWNPTPNSQLDSTASVSPDSTTIYTVTVSDCGGIATATATATVTVFPSSAPTVTITANPTGTICPGSMVTFTADTTNGNGGPTPSFQWQLNGANAGTNSITFSSNTLQTGDMVDVIMTTSAPCPNPATDTSNQIVIAAYPPVTVSTSGDTTICPGQPVTICAVAANGTGGPYFYSWNNGAGTSNCPIVTPFTTGANVYTVAATDSCNSNPATGNVTVTVMPAPNASFVYSPSDVSILSPTVYFTDQSTNGSPVLWDFGDTICGNDTALALLNPSHKYCQPGTYTVKLVETNASGCTDSITASLEIKDEYYFYIPNSFTPNGDGVNDFFAPQGTDALQSLPLIYTMTIYNRWGERIFETDNTSQPWDGRANGGTKFAEAGVYVYLIKFQDPNYSAKQIVGSVTLVR